MKVDVQKLFDEFSHILQVEAIALGGSRATGRNDEKSDYDVYVYLSDSVDKSMRRNILEKYCKWKNGILKIGELNIGQKHKNFLII